MKTKKYKSETSKSRENLIKFCIGDGADLGFGGDKIKPEAIGIDLEIPYAITGTDKVQLHGDARNLKWFKNEVLDYVYSGHLLEDFENKIHVMLEWSRVLKVGGNLVLLLPDEQAYRKHCEKTSQIYNEHHKDPVFDKDEIKAIVETIGNLEVIHESEIINDYNFEIVFRKIK